MRRLIVAASFVFVVLMSRSALCATMTLNFEGFPDGATLTNQYPCITFANATILKAGLTLNEFEFPPHSGSNVASDAGGPLSISFATPATAFSIFSTYLVPLTLTAFNSANAPVALVTSKFSNNLACLAGPPCSGDPGSSPNELLTLSFASGMSKITIKGDPNGASFVLDDATITTPTGPSVPEPASIVLFTSGMLLLWPARRLSNRNRA